MSHFTELLILAFICLLLFVSSPLYGNWKIFTLQTLDHFHYWYPIHTLVIDKQGQLHLAYGEDNLYYLRSLNCPNGLAWSENILNNPTKVQGFAALALDNTDYPHICYHTDGYLVYAHHNETEWIFNTIDDSAYVGFSFSMVLDSDGNAHITYYDSNQRYLKYASNRKNDWDIEVVDDSQDVGMMNSLALDSDGGVHIAYLDWTNRDLKYAY